MYSYQELTEIVKRYFDEEQFIGTPSHLYEPIDYTLSLGGKRIRPVLLLAATQMFGGDIADARYAAIGIETFHNFTLLHDDLMDKSPIRRGKETVYRKWNENTAILSGDAMNILAWRYFLKKPHANQNKILNVFEKTSMEICEGQQYDMDFENCDNISIDQYMEMIRLKTAVLLAGAMHIGALYADAPQQEIDKLVDFGISIGLAFQLRDDLLDAYGDEKTFGKKIGTDIADNKKTYLYLRALEKADDMQRSELLQLFKTTPADPSEKINRVLQIYSSLGIRQDVENTIEKLHNDAMAYLDSINCDNGHKEPIKQIAYKLLDRNV